MRHRSGGLAAPTAGRVGDGLLELLAASSSTARNAEIGSLTQQLAPAECGLPCRPRRLCERAAVLA